MIINNELKVIIYIQRFREKEEYYSYSSINILNIALEEENVKLTR